VQPGEVLGAAADAVDLGEDQRLRPTSTLASWTGSGPATSCEEKFSAPGRAPPRTTTMIASAAFVEKINTKEVSVDLMEITEKERLSREQAAARLHALADALARHNEVEFERGGLRFTVHVPDEVDFKLEIEIGEDERELEVEITW
jgi:amphi-Trp domain-containing protein